MSYAMRSRSDRRPEPRTLWPRRARRGRHGILPSIVFGLAIGIVLIPLPGLTPSIFNSELLLIPADRIEPEDVYATANSANIEGTIDGDLVIAVGNMTIGGTVTGDVLVLSSGKVTISGVVEGSVRGVAREVVVVGSVGDDVSVATLNTRVNGKVARDVLVVTGSLDVTGEVGRDVRGRFVSGTINGHIVRNVDVSVSRLELGPSAVVDGDVVYRSSGDARVSAAASIAGQLARLPTRNSFSVGLYVTLATVLSFLAFVVSGLALFWLLRGTAPRAAGLVVTRPGRTVLVGLATLFLLPTVGVIFALTIVGIPIAVLLVLTLLMGLVFGPVPAVTAVGHKVLRTRGGIFGAFVVGAVIWRVGIALIPFVGVALYLAALVWGMGAWVMAAWQQRQLVPPAPLLPASVRSRTETVPDDWEPPLPPEPAGAVTAPPNDDDVSQYESDT